METTRVYLIFSRQLEALGRPGDVAIGISTMEIHRTWSSMATAGNGAAHSRADGRFWRRLKGRVTIALCASNETPRIQEGIC